METGKPEILGTTLPSPLIGETDLKRLQKEGWSVAAHGVKLGNGYAVWAQKGEEFDILFLADPEQYPHAWGKESPADEELDLFQLSTLSPQLSA